MFQPAARNMDVTTGRHLNLLSRLSHCSFASADCDNRRVVGQRETSTLRRGLSMRRSFSTLTNPESGSTKVNQSFLETGKFPSAMLEHPRQRTSNQGATMIILTLPIAIVTMLGTPKLAGPVFSSQLAAAVTTGMPQSISDQLQKFQKAQ